MLKFMIGQYLELANLDRALADIRLMHIHAALNGNGIATNSTASEQQTEQAVKRIRMKYRERLWTAHFPEDPSEPDANVKKVLFGAREMALKFVVMLHRTIMATPVVGCEPGGNSGA